MDQPQTRFTKTSDGVSIAYCTIGRGPSIVNMPMMPTTHIDLEWNVEAMRESLESVAAVGSIVRYDGRPRQ